MLHRLPLRSRLALVGLVLLFGAATLGVRWWGEQRAGAQVVASARAGDIQMLASDDCVYCAQARAWFGARHVPFSECAIERDAACAAAYAALGSPGTPVLVVRGQRLAGFNVAAIAEALTRAQRPGG